jgi:hypothetical protein
VEAPRGGGAVLAVVGGFAGVGDAAFGAFPVYVAPPGGGGGAALGGEGGAVGAEGGAAPDASGSDFLVEGTNGSFLQTGIATIDGLNGSPATVRIDIPALGAITLAGLNVPGGNLILSSPGGVLTGNLAVGNLLVLGTTGSSNLFGSVQGITGPAAAAVAQIQPAINDAYLLNDCVIASPVCGQIGGLTGIGDLTQTPLLLLPDQDIDQLALASQTSVQPLVIDLSFPPTLPGEANPEIVLPNVSSRDY